MADKFPCKNCTSRHIGCHATCKEYIDAKAKYDIEQEALKIENSSKYIRHEHEYIPIRTKFYKEGNE